MTNSQSVEQDGIVAGNVFAMLNNANRGVNRMKFISLATVPSNTISYGLRHTSVPSGILIHAAGAATYMAENWGLRTLLGRGLGPHLTQSPLG